MAWARHVNVIKTGEHTFCVIAEWTDMDAIVNARDRMIATLDCSVTPSKTLAAGSASPTGFRPSGEDAEVRQPPAASSRRSQ